ncbi:MAG: hypothetical protein IJ146_08470 [Kiritimatiellae bacterium]|nr:hypothetical protein [Kiritimatiellia bacterium]
MNVLEGIDALKNGLMWVGLSALAAIAVGVIGAWLCRGVASATRRLLTVARIIAFAVVSAFCVLRGGAKFLMPLPSTGGTPVVPVVVTQEEIAQGWRLESVTTNEAVSYAMPTNGVEYMSWSLGGGYEMHFPLDLGDDFGFPFGTGMVRRLDVLSGGMVESLPRQRVGGLYHSLMSICAAREYASIVPGVGRFWWAGAARPESAPYRVKLISWEDLFGGRDRTGQYSAQIEFHDDGNFITRSNNVERVYRRVLPYDLDNDGLPNDIDPAPEVPLVPSAWNQSEEWAAAAFPSNPAEISAMGGYAAWAAARGADPDRRLVSLGVVFDDGSVRPTLLDFGGVPVVADGTAELAFAIDCGARVPFTLTSGRLGSLAVTATEPPTRSGEGMTTTESSEFLGYYVFPHERTVNDVKVHLDGPRSGWLCRTAGVSVEPSWLPHFSPDDSVELTAEVSGCHSNAYLGCTWTGGAGITFSQEHSLSTTVTYDPDEPDIWATNGIDLITQFVGYTLTNHINVTVGVQVEPPLGFSLGCQEIFFLNDAELGSTSNRAERIRPVTLNLTGPVGTNGTARLSVQGNVNPVLFQVVDGVTNRVTSETVFPLAVTDDFAHTGSSTFYMSCPNLGTGTITATFTPADGGEPLTDSVTFRCIEPLRKLVNSQRDVSAPRIVNPSRLVYGTNAVLCVDYNGPFQESEIHWHVKEGSATVNPTVGKRVVVTPTAADGVVTVEARFNGDEIQPQFVLPIVQERVLDVRAFVVASESDGRLKVAMEDEDIRDRIHFANFIFRQIGVRFNLLGIETLSNSSQYWDIVVNERTGIWPFREIALSDQVRSLIQSNNASGCINMYFVGSIRKDAEGNEEANGFRIPGCVFVKGGSAEQALAHELGHMLGLWDCYDRYRASDGEDPLVVPDDGLPISASRFRSRPRDWGDETGRGFYAATDTYRSILQQFLMFGEEMQYRYNLDIPDGAVECLNNNNHQKPSIGFGEIGATYVKPTNEGVYAK